MTNEKPYDIVGLGCCTLDYLVRVDEFPSQESVQRTDESSLQGGGPVSTALAAAARLGAKTTLLDRVGDDWRGNVIVEELNSFGVETKDIQRATDHSSTMASVWVRKNDGNRAIAFSTGSAPELSADELPEAIIPSARILHTNGRHWEALFQAAQIATSAGTLVSFDGGAHRFREPLREFMPLVDIAIVARDFAEQFAETRDLDQAAGIIRKSGPSLVGITCGTEGSWTYPENEAPFHQPAFPVEDVVDTTGCGDVYHGAFLTGLAWDWELKRCAQLASAAAAQNARALGGRGNLSTLEDLSHWIDHA